jgi:hypothetical protein
MSVYGIPQIGVNKLQKILNYNSFGVSKQIREGKADWMKPYFSHYSIFESYDKFGLNLNPVYDRSGAIPHYLNMADIHPMPAPDMNYNRSFYEVAKERAIELLQENSQINVCWSGGIDSTFVLCILSEVVPADWITVYGTYASIIESGDIFDKFIKNKFKTRINIFPSQEVKTKVEYGIWVTGFQGNQLFGPTDNFFSSNREVAFFHHTLGTKETIYEDYRKHIDPELLEFLQPAIDRSPRKIETVADLRWYCIFNFDWYNGKYAMMNEMNIPKILSVRHFFDTEEFQKWAINTSEPWTKVRGNPNTHRWQMRELIADYGMVEYAKNKSKAVSCFTSEPIDWCFLLEDYTNVYSR